MLPHETIVDRNQRLFGCDSPVALVTGSAAPRVGRRIAEFFLSQNFRIVFHAHRADAEAHAIVAATRDQGHPAMLVAGAVEDEQVVGAWVSQIMETFGRIDVLVNSAAIWEPKRLEDARAADFEQFFRVNALGTVLCCQHLGLAMTRQASGGAIINVGDWAVARPYRDFAPYFLSKAGIQTLTQTLAIELAHRNPRVRVNAVLPGPIQLADGISLTRRARIIEDCLLQREGTADDLAQAVLFLATSPFVTGVCLPVDGGRTVWGGDSNDSIAHPSVDR